MLRKVFAYALVLTLLTLAFLGTPSSARAGGVCGGAYTAEAGDTVDKLAAMCGTSASAIYAANPGIGASLSAGQTLTIPSLNYGVPSTPTPVVDNYYDPLYYYNYYYYYPSANNAGTYTVQPGDTVYLIASRYGVSVYDLWGANPQIWDINLLYAGQVLYIPAPYYAGTATATPAVVTAATVEPGPLSWGKAPRNVPYGNVTLSNQAKADVYVSLQGTTGNGTSVINEYPVNGTIDVDIPAGWIVYVAWVGGQKFTGAFQLTGETFHTITFYKNRVVVDG
ncbi:MAG: LysM peptidoglycan-binding domain-containing protein [Anaerolineales bacterium]